MRRMSLSDINDNFDGPSEASTARPSQSRLPNGHPLPRSYLPVTGLPAAPGLPQGRCQIPLTHDENAAVEALSRHSSENEIFRPKRFNFTLLLNKAERLASTSSDRSASNRERRGGLAPEDESTNRSWTPDSRSLAPTLPPIPPVSPAPEQQTMAQYVMLYHGEAAPTKQGELQTLDESLWSPCWLLASPGTLHFEGRTVAIRDVELVCTPAELGAFVFQLHTQTDDVITFRASSLSQLTDCCEALWAMMDAQINARSRRADPTSSNWSPELSTFRFPRPSPFQFPSLE